MNKFIYIEILSFFLGCNTNNNSLNEKTILTADTILVNKEIFIQQSNYNDTDLEIDEKNNLPIYGKINRKNLIKYFPRITDTIKDLRIIGSEKIDLKLKKVILVSILHNTGTFDQMIVCTHDSNLNLIDNFYIGKATDFDKTSHTIEYEIINENSLRFDQVNWGYVKKGEEFEIDTIKYESYIISIDNQGKIKRKICSTTNKCNAQ